MAHRKAYPSDITVEQFEQIRPLVESILVDGGYTGKPFADGVMEQIEATVQVVKRNELHTFAVLPKRWIVERFFGWLESAEDLRDRIYADQTRSRISANMLFGK
jgi:transposase